ncbi:MAG: hypothetical protein J7K65_08375 [Planctomycetes bacterium]|nr:hypothetical protein [Planctomycetota bacterium]
MTENQKQARELLRFTEDQFVVRDTVGLDWGRCEQKRVVKPQRTIPRRLTPCVLEQYYCYSPVARSGAIMITAYRNPTI